MTTEIKKKCQSFVPLSLIPGCEIKLTLEALYGTISEKEQLKQYLDYLKKKTCVRKHIGSFF